VLSAHFPPARTSTKTCQGAKYANTLVRDLLAVYRRRDRLCRSCRRALISKDLELSPSQLGIVFSAFFVGYSIFCFVGGYFSDRIRPKPRARLGLGLVAHGNRPNRYPQDSDEADAWR
jgi:hypothetical protein